MKTIRNAAGLALIAVLLFGAYTVISGSHDIIPWSRGQVPQVTTTPDEGNTRVKMSMVIDGDEGNRVNDTISIRYFVDGVRVPKHGGFTTKRYWTRTIEVREGATIRLEAENNNNRVTVDVLIAKDNPRKGEARTICHDSVYGKGVAECQGNAAS